LPVVNLHDNAVAAADAGGGLGDLGLSSGGRHVDRLGFVFSVKKRSVVAVMTELMMRRRVGLRVEETAALIGFWLGFNIHTEQFLMASPSSLLFSRLSLAGGRIASVLDPEIILLRHPLSPVRAH
jgi:hypothetical protein